MSTSRLWTPPALSSSPAIPACASCHARAPPRKASAYAVAQSLPGLLQLSFAVRGLEYASLFRSLGTLAPPQRSPPFLSPPLMQLRSPPGPLLVTVRGMLVDITRFGGLYAFVLIGFANAFFVLFALSGESLDYGGYPRILQEQLLWLLSSVDRSLLDGLTGQLHATGDVLFWGYIVLSYFVLLNLLIAVFNSTFEKVQRQAFNEWLFLRMATMCGRPRAPSPRPDPAPINPKQWAGRTGLTLRRGWRSRRVVASRMSRPAGWTPTTASSKTPPTRAAWSWASAARPRPALAAGRYSVHSRTHTVYITSP